MHSLRQLSERIKKTEKMNCRFAVSGVQYTMTETIKKLATMLSLTVFFLATVACMAIGERDAEHAENREHADAVRDESAAGMDHDQARRRLDAWVEANDGRAREFTVTEASTISCSRLAGGPPGYLYVALVTRSQGASLRISFDAALKEEVSLDLLREHFHVLSLIYNPTDLELEGWDVRLGGDVALRRRDEVVEFTGWQDGRVQGTLRRNLTRISGLDRTRAECQLADARLPETCSIRADVQVPLTIHFDLAVPDGEFRCD